MVSRFYLSNFSHSRNTFKCLYGLLVTLIPVCLDSDPPKSCFSFDFFFRPFPIFCMDTVIVIRYHHSYFVCYPCGLQICSRVIFNLGSKRYSMCTITTYVALYATNLLYCCSTGGAPGPYASYYIIFCRIKILVVSQPDSTGLCISIYVVIVSLFLNIVSYWHDLVCSFTEKKISSLLFHIGRHINISTHYLVRIRLLSFTPISGPRRSPTSNIFFKLSSKKKWFNYSLTSILMYQPAETYVLNNKSQLQLLPLSFSSLFPHLL